MNCPRSRKSRGSIMPRIKAISSPEEVKHFFSLKNRTIWEEEIINEYFWPLKHQEAMQGADFDRWSNISNTLCQRGRRLYRTHLDEVLLGYEPANKGMLQEEVRDLIVRVNLRVIFGKELDVTLAQEALKEFDRRIKLTKTKNKSLRRNFVKCFAGHLKNEWIDPNPRSLVFIAKQKFQLDDELTQQLLSVFLITGTIQLADSVVHCLLAGENFAHTMFRYPVNKNLTREGKNGTMYSLRPETVNKEGGKCLFGDGPRRCPASIFAPTFVDTLTDFYRKYPFQTAETSHKRSLHRLIPYSFSNKPNRSRWVRIKDACNYWFNAVILGVMIKYLIMRRR